MTDEPLAEIDFVQIRAARFGTLPPRVRPENVVETVDTTLARGRPESAVSEALHQVILAGG